MRVHAIWVWNSYARKSSFPKPRGHGSLKLWEFELHDSSSEEICPFCVSGIRDFGVGRQGSWSHKIPSREITMGSWTVDPRDP
jgi:hypothetical protein